MNSKMLLANEASTQLNIQRFDIGSVVQLKKAVRASEGQIPKGRVGMVSDVLVSAASGKISYVVAFQQIEDWAMVRPKELKPYVPRGLGMTSPPKIPDDV